MPQAALAEIAVHGGASAIRLAGKDTPWLPCAVPPPCVAHPGSDSRAGTAARRGAWGVARVVSLITSVVVGLIVVGHHPRRCSRRIATTRSSIGSSSAAHWLVGPFDNVFKPDGHKARVAVNWGLAAVLYAIVGGFIARLLRR